MTKKNNWPSFTKEEGDAVKRILLSNKVNYLFGGEGKRFEKNFSDFTNSKFSLALANGTLALDLCLRAIGIKKGDEVIVTGRTFIASASCISLLGGKPVFVDVNINSQNIDLISIKKALTKKTKAVICVHFAGFPCDMPSIIKFAKHNKLFVIEDCAQAHGARIAGKSVGSFGDINAWSFCNDKIMTTGGEGGMITTNNPSLFKKAASFNNHGKNLTKFFDLSDKKISMFPYIHDSLGLNYRMTEMQSAIGNIQLSRIQKWNQIRNRNAEVIINKIKNLNIVKVPKINSEFNHAFYKLYLVLQSEFIKSGFSRDDIIDEITKRGVSVSFGASGRVFLEKGFKTYKTIPKGLPNSTYLEQNSLMFEVHPTITLEEIRLTASKIYDVLLEFEK
tara:strand:- start:5727 stop:6899 length:1173 start_codon:yes stop_codon:yes gene_type:complete